MDKEISKIERYLFYKISNRLRSYKRSTAEQRFEKYKRLIHTECIRYSNMSIFHIKIMIDKLKDEIERIENLPKKKFTAEFGPKRVWNKKHMSDSDRLIYERTKRNEKRSKELHRPTF